MILVAVMALLLVLALLRAKALILVRLFDKTNPVWLKA